ncbi:deleted in malignant brain tumors 1 protein-like [Heptranchias perlo]|uniref:deleted in malignant brain tumors 1 protein-like n=1 Tax=Heptranchias perlo TaxID=212740 RepID=UPI00355A677C
MISEMVINKMMISEMMFGEMLINEMMIGEMMIGEMMIGEMNFGEKMIDEMMSGEKVINEMMIGEMMIGEMIISEMIISEMMIGDMIISEMVINEMMIGEMMIGEMMINEFDLSPRKLLPRFSISFHHPPPGYSVILHYHNARSVTGFLFILTQAIGLSGEGETVKLRLVNGGSPCAGRVEIHYKGQWGTVNHDFWDLRDAAVVCRELGCGAALSAPGGAHFGKGSGPIVTYDVECGGTEAALRDCVSRPWDHRSWSHSKDAGVICSGSSKPRLVNGGSPCAGRLEINWSGTWRTVCGDRSWDLWNAEAVCEELGCGSGIAAPLDAHFGEGSVSVIGPPGCGHKRDVGVICSDHRVLRLVSWSNRCSGRVEVLHGEQWGSVCDIYFGLEDASVVCQHLKCGAVITTPGGAHFGEGTGPVSKTNYRCRGNESRLWDCPVSSWDQIRCSHGNDASVICSDEGWPPRLTNGESRCDGRVEIYYNGSWGRVWDNIWNLNDANVVCRQLDCGYAISAYNSSKYGEGEGPVWVNDVQCDGYESQLRSCSSFTLNPLLTDSIGVGVLCSDHVQIRLSDGGSPCAGRVEVYYSGTWGSVCDDSWDLVDADVVCRQLGCGNALEAALPASCGQGSGPVWLDELSCSGKESFLWDCPSAPWGQHDCAHKEDVRVVCSEHKEMRLVNGQHRCEGRVEVFYNGTWGTVCSENLDPKDAEVICKQLQCGPITSVEYDTRLFGEGSGPIWLDEIECNSHESFLWQCQSDPWGEHNCHHREDAGVVCSDVKVPDRSHSSSVCVRDSGSKDGHLPGLGQPVRLVGGNTNCSGRVEILSNNGWGTVCDDSWDMADANVVCRQLHCGPALLAPGGASFARGDGVIWLDEVKCTGSESFLSDCRSSPPGQHDCYHKEDASVICSGLNLSPTASPSTSAGQGGKGTSIPLVVCITLGVLLICELIALMVVIQRKSTRRGAVIRGRGSPAGFYQVIYEEIENIPPGEVSAQLRGSGSVPGDYDDVEPGDFDSQEGQFPLESDPDDLGGDLSILVYSSQTRTEPGFPVASTHGNNDDVIHDSGTTPDIWPPMGSEIVAQNIHNSTSNR